MSAAVREKKSRIRLPAFLFPSRKESKELRTAVPANYSDVGQSATLSRVSMSTMAADGDIIFTRKHSSISDLTSLPNYSSTFDKSDVTSSSIKSTTVAVSVDSYVTTSSVQQAATNNASLSSPPNKPDRKKRPAPSPTSRDQVTAEVKVSNPSKSTCVTDEVTVSDVASLQKPRDQPRDQPVTAWQPNDLDSQAVSCSSPGDAVIVQQVNLPPQRIKRQAPAPPPVGQLGTNVKLHTESANSPGRVDDVTSVMPRREKPCRFEAPPPPSTPPPISVDLSTQVYITKRNSLTSECISFEECSSLISDISDDVTDRQVQDQDKMAVTVFAKSMVSEMDDLTNRAHIHVTSSEATNDGLCLQSDVENQRQHNRVTSSVSDTDAVIDTFNALIDEDSSVYHSPHEVVTSSQPTEVGWYTSRVEPEGASSEEMISDAHSIVKDKEILAKETSNGVDTEADCHSRHSSTSNNDIDIRETVIVNVAEQRSSPQHVQCVVSQNETSGTTVVYVRSEPSTKTFVRETEEANNNNYDDSSSRHFIDSSRHDNACHDNGEVSSGDEQSIVFPVPKRKMACPSDNFVSRDEKQKVAETEEAALLRDLTADVIIPSVSTDNVHSLRQLTSRSMTVTQAMADESSDAGEYRQTFALPTLLNIINNNSNTDDSIITAQKQTPDTIYCDSITSNATNNARTYGNNDGDNDVILREFPLPKRMNGLNNSTHQSLPSIECDVIVTSNIDDDDSSSQCSTRNDHVTDDSFNDVIQHHVESFLDAFIPMESKFFESSNDEASVDYSSDDVIDSENEPDAADVERFYFNLEESCSSQHNESSSDSPVTSVTKHVISDVISHCENMRKSEAPQPQGQAITTLSDDVTRVIQSSEKECVIVMKKLLPVEQQMASLNFATSLGDEPEITATTSDTPSGASANLVSDRERSRENKISRYHVTHDIMTSSEGDHGYLSKHLSVESQSKEVTDSRERTNDVTSDVSESNKISYDITSTIQHIKVESDVKNFATPSKDKINISVGSEKMSYAKHINHGTNIDSHLMDASDDVTDTVLERPLVFDVGTQKVAASSKISPQRVAVSDVPTLSKSLDTASSTATAASDVTRPRKRRSGLQFVHQPKQVVLIELSTSSSTNKPRSIADDISKTSMTSPSDDKRRKSSTSRRSSEETNDNVDQKEFSSTLLMLRANLKTSQVRQGSVSTRFTAIDTELSRSIDLHQ